jgi:heme exporter protein C
VFTALTLALGSIWGRPTWGVWWAWDARLTSTAVLLVIFVGYLVLRSFADDEQRRAKWSAAIGIFGALNVPVVYMSVKWWRTLHQMESTPQTLAPAYARALGTSVTAMMLVAAYFVAKRFQVARDERDAELAADRLALEFTDDEVLEEEKEPVHV